MTLLFGPQNPDIYPDIMDNISSFVDPKTLITSFPRVSKAWRDYQKSRVDKRIYGTKFTLQHHIQFLRLQKTIQHFEKETLTQVLLFHENASLRSATEEAFKAYYANRLVKNVHPSFRFILNALKKEKNSYLFLYHPLENKLLHFLANNPDEVYCALYRIELFATGSHFVYERTKKIFKSLKEINQYAGIENGINILLRPEMFDRFSMTRQNSYWSPLLNFLDRKINAFIKSKNLEFTDKSSPEIFLSSYKRSSLRYYFTKDFDQSENFTEYHFNPIENFPTHVMKPTLNGIMHIKATLPCIQFYKSHITDDFTKLADELESYGLIPIHLGPFIVRFQFKSIKACEELQNDILLHQAAALYEKDQKELELKLKNTSEQGIINYFKKMV